MASIEQQSGAISSYMVKANSEKELAAIILKGMTNPELHPFRKSWNEKGLLKSRPYNYYSGNTYHGYNRFILSFSDYTDTRWLTFKQARLLKGNVRKGEKAHVIFFWTVVPKKQQLSTEEANTETEKSQEGSNQKKKSSKSSFIVKSFHVFNFQQCEGLKETHSAPPELSWKPLEKAEEILTRLNPKIERTNLDKACYFPKEDSIAIPKPEFFRNQEEYYSTLFHEIAHWTGAKARLDRDKGESLKEKAYEELVAEITSIFVCSEIGINYDIDNNYAYLKSWYELLKEKPDSLVRAIQQAQKAYNYIVQDKAKAQA